MKQKVFKGNAMVFKALQEFAHIVQTGTQSEIITALGTVRNNPLFQSNGWQYNWNKLQESFIAAPRFSVFALDGNSKLPFISFSTLPGGAGCPGAGECLAFCYSFNAWRYPAAFMRQAQNTYYMRYQREKISEALNDIKAKPKYSKGFDFRLYVDGDFMDLGQVAYWMQTLKAYPEIRAYGYSKSFSQLLKYQTTGISWPLNYQLNLSSGHNADSETFQAVKALPITRGEFRAISIGKPVKSVEHGTRETNSRLRENVQDARIFPCPGKCGSCTPKGHACGSSAFKGVVIAIAVH